MNKKLLIIGGLVILVLAAVFLFSKKGDNPSMNGDSMAGSSNVFSGKFTDLLTQGKNFSCTYSANDDVMGNATGTFYVAAADKKFSGEFTTTTTEDKTINGHIVGDGTYAYIWTDDETQGLKMKMDENDNDFFSNPSSLESAGFNPEEAGKYDCSPWVVDASKFTPPANIEFTDLSSQMDNIKEMMKDTSETSDSSNQCSACDNIPVGDARNSCLQALGC